MIIILFDNLRQFASDSWGITQVKVQIHGKSLISNALLYSRGKEFIALIEIIENLRRDLERLGENVVPHFIQANGNADVGWHSAIKSE